MEVGKYEGGNYGVYRIITLDFGLLSNEETDDYGK